MFEPNLYTLTEASVEYGLHKFKDGEVHLAQRHKSGDWFTIRPARQTEAAHFAAHGTKAVHKPRPAAVRAGLVPADLELALEDSDV